MAKRGSVQFKNVDKVKQNMLRSLISVKKNKALLNDMAETHVKRIRLEARRGRAMRGIGRSDSDLPALTEFTIIARRILVKYNKKHRSARPKSIFSNLTLTGQLLDGLDAKVTHRDGKYVLSFKGQRSKLKLPTREQFFKDFKSEIKFNKSQNWVGVYLFLVKNSKNQITSLPAIYKGLLKIDKRYKVLSINSKLFKGMQNKVKRVLRRTLRARGF